MYRANRQRGVGLIEVLVALVVMAVGVLGYAGMQLMALRGAEAAGYRAQATLVAVDALERILLNADARATYFNMALWPTTTQAPGGTYPTACSSAACTSAALATADLTELAWVAANSLPGGLIAAKNDCTGIPSPSCVVLSWDEMTPTLCLDGDAINTTDSCVVMEAMRL
jgi:type IV pilus assembly protein PilV